MNCNAYWIMDFPTQMPVWLNSPPSEMTCTICSDKAEGYHFGAISCAACGAFFRRSVSAQKVYSCQARQCCVQHDPRKRGGSCRFCRFARCLSSGMAPQDVKAKRAVTQTQNVTSFYRSLSQASQLLIDQIVGLWRCVSAESTHYEVLPSAATRTTFLSFLHQKMENLKRISLGSPIFMQITENLNFLTNPNLKAQNDPLFDIFLSMFIFESCLLTFTKGGLQLYRFILSNSTFVDVGENQFLEFLQFDNVSNLEAVRPAYNAFSFLVQVVGRTFQTANFDETNLSILFCTVISELVPFSLRNQYSELSRRNLWTDLNRASVQTVHQLPQFEVLTRQIHEGTRTFKSIISHF